MPAREPAHLLQPLDRNGRGERLGLAFNDERLVAQPSRTLTDKPLTVLQQLRPEFQSTHMFRLNAIAIKIGRVKRKFRPVIKLNWIALSILLEDDPLGSPRIMREGVA